MSVAMQSIQQARGNKAYFFKCFQDSGYQWRQFYYEFLYWAKKLDRLLEQYPPLFCHRRYA